MKLESMNNQKNDLLTAIKKYMKKVVIGTCTFAFCVSFTVILSKEKQQEKKNQKTTVVMEQNVEVSGDLSSVRQVLNEAENAMIETMFAQSIAQDNERKLLEEQKKEEAVKNETTVVAVASTSNTPKTENYVYNTTPVKEASTPEIAGEEMKKEEIPEVVTAERETVAAIPAESDYDMLCRIVEAEATGKDVEAKLMVANVVLNRVECPQFPNSIQGVIFQNRGGVYQFSPVRDGRYYSVTVTDGTKEAVNRAMAGEDNSQGALYFVSPKYGNTSWFDRNLTFLYYYGGHNFYR